MEFILGCNYWASNAGTEMWNQWDEKTVQKDLEILAAHGVTHMRVFPNWRDFQPVFPVIGGMGRTEEYLLEGDRKPENPYWLDKIMLERFGRFCDLCEQYQIKLIVGLLTGWMSGRLFIPPALYGKDLFRDPVALLFEQRFVKGMVSRFKGKSAIYAWDLGNECNCMGEVEEEAAASVWTAMIANGIRANDPTRPVVSGMHSLGITGETAEWTIRGQAEFCDILTTHPYPFWIEEVYKEQMDSFRTLIHATAQTRYYGDIGKKPCLVEEVGTMGPMICSEDTAAGFLKVNLFSNWANQAEGVMWWCANDQNHLTTIPYTRQMVETELGLLRENGEVKPVLKALKSFSDFLAGFARELPEALWDVVGILPQGQEQEGAAYMAYALGKQAGLNLRFIRWDDELPEAACYLVPSAEDHRIMPKECYQALKEKVREGAVLCVSSGGGLWSDFTSFFGSQVLDSVNYEEQSEILVDEEELPIWRNRSFRLKPVQAEVLETGKEGYPEMTVHTYGKGKVYFLNFPLEKMLLKKHDVLTMGYYKIYERVFAECLHRHAVQVKNPFIGLTIHSEGKDRIYCVAVNYSGKRQKLDLKIKENYQIERVYYGKTDILEQFEAVVFSLKTI